jgi:transcriptional regulator GlxA family with amidase domain
MNDRGDAIRVRLLALPESAGSALYGLFDILAMAGELWSIITGAPPPEPGFDVRVVGPSREPFRCWGGVPVAPDGCFADNTGADVVLIPDLLVDPDADPRRRWPEAAAWVAREHDAGAAICTVCTGSLLLADTGLLDGREATTHWSCVPLFQRYHPRVRLRAERLLVAADPDQRIVTAGGASAWQDMALYLIGRHQGQAAAVAAAKAFLLGDHGEGQLPYTAMIRPRQHTDAAVAAAQTWIAENYAVPNPVARMAERAGLPDRTFKRRFRAATGFTPVEYVQTVRIEEAKQYLETTALNAEDIAERVGYSDPAFFRRLFRRHSGTTPAAYRQRYADLGAAPAS